MAEWADVMLRQSHIWASRASPAQKLQGLRVVCSKNFSRATFFVFWSNQMVDIYFTRETNLMKKCSVYLFWGTRNGNWTDRLRCHSQQRADACDKLLKANNWLTRLCKLLRKHCKQFNNSIHTFYSLTYFNFLCENITLSQAASLHIHM